MRGSFLVAAATSVMALTFAGSAAAAGPKSAHHARGTAGVFWFMHLSDLHTSCDWNPTNEHQNMELAFGPAVQVIKPRFVVATGDLVDASPFGVPTTGQGQGEWDEFKGLYTAAGMTPDFFFDLPGNHDGYGDVGFTHYLASSLQGSTNGSTYTSWDVDTELGTYRFIGLDSAGNGSGPFSEQPEFLPSQVASMQADIAASPAPELVFVLAHHPISSPKNSSAVIATMKAAGGGYYLHGHAHEYEEYIDGDSSIVVNEISTLGQSGADNIGVAAVDHNGFVYRATGTSAPWPFVVITAPIGRSLRDGETNPYAYTVCKDRKDNPVRALVFGDTAPSSVSVEIAGAAAVQMTAAGQPENLWEADVDTTGVATGVVPVTVYAIVGGELASHTVSADFVDGPCAELPDDPPLDGGVDAGTDAGDVDGGAGASGAGGAAGTGGTGPEGGSGGSASSPSSTGGASVIPSKRPPSSEESGGCGCESVGRRPAGLSLAALFGLMLWVAARRRR